MSEQGERVGWTPRQVQRTKVFRPGSMRRGSDETRVHLLDVSVHGARAHSDPLPEEGERVILRCEELECSAVVTWVRHPIFGLTFVLPSDEDTITALVGKH